MLGKKTSRKTAISNNPNIPKWIVITFTWSLSNLFLKLEIFILNIPDKMFQLFMQRYLYFFKNSNNSTFTLPSPNVKIWIETFRLY
jgi:hypothetical protein